MDLLRARRASTPSRINAHLGARLDRRRPRHEATGLANVGRRGAARTASGSSSPSTTSARATTPLTDEERGDFAAYAARSCAATPTVRDIDRRQRAEPQPLLAAAVRRRRQRTPPRRPTWAARAHVRRAEGRRAGRHASGRLALAARRRRPDAGRDTHSPTTFIQDLGAGVPGERPHAARHGRLRVPSVRATTRASRRAALPADPDHVGLADYGKLVRLLGKAFDGTAQPGSTLPILYDEFGVETRDPGGEGDALHRHRAGDDEAGRRGDAGGLLPAGDRSSRSASRTSSDAALPHRRRADLDRWQSGLFYADGTPKASLLERRPARDRARGRRRHVARCPGRGEGRPTAFTDAPHARRSRSGASARLHLHGARLVRLPRRTARSATSVGRAAAGLRRAVVRLRPGGAARPGWYQLGAVSVVRAGLRRRGARRSAPARRMSGAAAPRRRARRSAACGTRDGS